MVIGATPQQWRMIDDELICDDHDGWSLRGARCQDCVDLAVTTFPYQSSCPRCGGERMAALPLPRRGRLWSFTIQRFRPPTARLAESGFAPYAVGYVDLGPVIVEARIDENDPTRLRIGQPVSLCSLPLYDADGIFIHTFAFRPETS
jgi:uncharacterized OB-fold protein